MRTLAHPGLRARASRLQIPMGGSNDDEKEADCEVKFRFLPNSVVAIKTSPTSYHSVPNSNIKHMPGLDRNILTVEWYKTGWV